MFIAHLPAGYLLTKYVQKTAEIRHYLWLGLFASIVPDLDMFYFYLVDNRQTNHHDYFTHMPMFWLAMLFFSAVFVRFFMRSKRAYFAILVFYSNIFLHMILDSYAGYIKWFHPFSDLKVNLVEVPANYDFWVWSFVLHWSFLAEVGIIIAAILLFIKMRKRAKTN